MLKDNSSVLDSHFNFLQAIHEEDPLIDGPVGTSQVHNNHLKDHAGRFTNSIVQHIREASEVTYAKQDPVVHALNVPESRSCRAIDNDVVSQVLPASPTIRGLASELSIPTSITPPVRGCPRVRHRYWY